MASVSEAGTMAKVSKKDTKVKLCKNCKHFAPDWDSYGFYETGNCIHPAFQYTKFNYITGNTDTYNADYGVDAVAARESKRCGPEGKLWEPIPPRREFSLLGWLRGKNNG